MAEITMNNLTRMQKRRIHRKKFRRKLFLLGISTAMLLVLVLFFIIGIKIFTSFSSERTVNKFTRAMQAENYSEAYRHIACNGPLLTEEAFIAAQKAQGRIDEISFKSLRKNNFMIREVRAGEISEYYIKAINNGGWIFSEWRIDAEPFTEEISIFTKTKGAKLKCGKIDLGSSSGQKPLTYRSFTGYRHTATMHLEGAQNYIFEIPANRSVQLGYLEVTSELRDSLSELIYQYKHELSQSYLDWHTDRLIMFLKPGGEGQKWVNNTINSLKTKGVKKDKRLLVFKPGNAYLEDDKHAVIEIEETWSDAKKPVKFRYRLEKARGNWKIVTAIVSN